MEMAFTISQDALKFHVAGLTTQGFSDSEAVAALNAGRR
jgi:hypothetical protein